MKYSRVILLVGVVLLLAQVSFAQGTIDPSIVFGGGGSCGTTFMETATTQSFTVDTVSNPACTGTNGYIDFKNEIAGGTFDIKSLLVTVTSAFDGSVSCFISLTQPQTFFNSATATATNACSFTEVITGPLLSIPGTAIYGLQLGGPNPFTGAAGPFTSGGSVENTVGLTLTAVPEPATLLLLGTGLCGIGALRKRLKGSKTTA